MYHTLLHILSAVCDTAEWRPARGAGDDESPMVRICKGICSSSLCSSLCKASLFKFLIISRRGMTWCMQCKAYTDARAMHFELTSTGSFVRAALLLQDKISNNHELDGSGYFLLPLFAGAQRNSLGAVRHLPSGREQASR